MTRRFPLAPFIPPEGDDEEIRSSPRPFRVESPGAANWTLERLAAARADLDSIDAQYRDAKARLEARRIALMEKAGGRVAWWESLLFDYATVYRRELLTGNSKTAEFINGSISYRKRAGRLVVEDESALVGWLVAQPIEEGLYRMKVEPEMNALKKLAAAGTVPPGCRWEPETESITIHTEPLALPESK